MRTLDEIDAAAVDGFPFSNHTDWEIWSYNWCERCRNDSPALIDQGKGCPLILVALMGKRPTEWLDGEGPSKYTCVEFRSEDDGPGPEPQPIPDPPGQATLLPREPYQGVRMYAGVAQKPAEVSR